MKLNKCLIILLIIFFTAIVCYGQKQPICNETDGEISNTDTFMSATYGKLKEVEGVVTYPDGSPTNAVIIIYKSYKENNVKNDYESVKKIAVKTNEIIRCKSDEKGKFGIKNIAEGFYLLKVGISENHGFGPVFVFLEISKKEGNKERIEITLWSAI